MMKGMIRRQAPSIIRPEFANVPVSSMRRVIVESPYSAITSEEKTGNLDFAADCCRDCVSRGENPFASHLFYTQFLDDNDPVERKLGLEMAFELWDFYDAIIFYMDRGFSEGMQLALIHAFQIDKPFERRILRQALPAPSPQKTIAHGTPSSAPEEVLKYAGKLANAQDSDTRADRREDSDPESGRTG
jgi:hypothetical protein